MSDVSDWWTTSIIDMEPGRIDIRGRAIQDLIGQLSFAEMIWLMLRGDIPAKGQADLLEAALLLLGLYLLRRRHAAPPAQCGLSSTHRSERHSSARPGRPAPGAGLPPCSARPSGEHGPPSAQ